MGLACVMSSLQKLLSDVALAESKHTEKTHQLTEADRMILDRRRELETTRQQVIAIKARETKWPTGSWQCRLLGVSAILFL